MSQTTDNYPVHGAGLGLRRGLMDQLMANPPTLAHSKTFTSR